MSIRVLARLGPVLLFVSFGFAQRSTNISGNVSLSDDGDETVPRILIGAGPIAPWPSAAVQINLTQQATEAGAPTGSGRAVVLFAPNRVDTLTITFEFPTSPRMSGTGTVTGGTGEYEGATGSGTFTLVQVAPDPGEGFTLNGTANITAGPRNVSLNVRDISLRQARALITNELRLNGAGTLAPLGDVIVEMVRTRDASNFQQIIATARLSPTNAFYFVFSFTGEGPPPSLNARLIGGTGAYVGATGNLTMEVSGGGDGVYLLKITGTVNQPAASPAAITSVRAAFGADGVSANTWLEIKGNNLTPPTTAAGGVLWSDAASFAQGRMPTQLGGVTVSINGRAGYIWWLCSKATTPECASDQINVLAPVDASTGILSVVVNNGTANTPQYFITKSNSTPTFLLIGGKGYVTATHLNGSLVGPESLYPGYTTPARRGETISLWATGFGLPSAPLTDGAATQSGTLPQAVACLINQTIVRPTAALVAPGLYQLNITIPNAAINGDNAMECFYAGTFTPVGNLLTVGP